MRRRIFFAIMTKIFRRGDFNGQQSFIQRSVRAVRLERERHREGQRLHNQHRDASDRRADLQRQNFNRRE